MDRRERIKDDAAITEWVVDSALRGMWCHLPGIIESVDMPKMICVVQPAIRGVHIKEKGEREFVNLPLLVDVPIVYPQGGFGILTFPIKKGDECLVMFADRCIDAWWQNGGIQGQIEFRNHDLSDGFALVGVRSQPRVLDPPPDPENVQLRSEDGKTHVSMKPDSTVVMINEKGTFKLRPSGQFVIDSDFDGESIIRAKKIHYYVDETVSDPFRAIEHEGF